MSVKTVQRLKGKDCLKEEDRETLLRANRIQMFLTQPFFGAQLYTNIPGEYVKLAETIRGFKGILEGQYDGLPEEAFRFVGAVDQAVEKAHGL